MKYGAIVTPAASAFRGGHAFLYVSETLIVSGDRIVFEGDNQKQADFLSRSLIKVDAKKIHDLHLIISSISRPEHLTLFEFGIAKKLDFSCAGPEGLRVAQLLDNG